MVQPLLVRPLPDGRYELIAGERRWRAAREAGLETVPAIVRDEDAAQRMQTALIENVAREDLNPVDEARACATLVDELGLSKEELAGRLGRTRPAISNLIRLLDLPDDVLELLSEGELSEGHGRAILIAKGNDVRRRLARDAVAAGWSVRETERRAKAAEATPRPGGRPPRSAGGDAARRGGARGGVRPRGPGPRVAAGAAGRAALRRRRRAARVRRAASAAPSAQAPYGASRSIRHPPPLAGVAEAVVQAPDPALPELDLLGDDQIPAPVRRAGHVAVAEARLGLVEALVELGPRGQRP